MPTSVMGPSLAGADLGMGLGDMLTPQLDQETEEQKRKRRLGLTPDVPKSQAVQSLFGVGGQLGGLRV